MKKSIFIALLLVTRVSSYSQISFGNFFVTDVSATTANINVYVNIGNCSVGGFYAFQYQNSQFFTNPEFVNQPLVTSSGMQSYTLTNLAPDTTYYWRCMGQLLSGCNQTMTFSATQSFTTSSLSNHTYSLKNRFNMHPNPASNVVHIAMESELKSVEIYSLQGQKILTSTQKEINVAGLSQGLYWVFVTDADDQKSTQKLIVE